MKNVFLFIILILAIACSENKAGQTDIEQSQLGNDTVHLSRDTTPKPRKIPPIINAVYVTAESGLLCRAESDVNSERIGKFDFGEKLGLIEKTKIPFEISDGGNRVQGEWIKVISTNYITPSQRQVGYVFSGFTVDSAQADFSKLPHSFSHIEFPGLELEGYSFDLVFHKISPETFHSYLNKVQTTQIIRNPSKNTINESYEDSHFLLKTEKAILRFDWYSTSGYYYHGLLKPLNAYIISYIGGGMESSFLIGRENHLRINLPAEFDSGGSYPILSPTHKKMLVFGSADSYRYHHFYDIRSYIQIYNLGEGNGLRQLKRSGMYTTKDWEIENMVWIDDNSFAIKVIKELANRKLEDKYFKVVIK